MKMGQSPLPCLPSPGDSSGQWGRVTSSHWGVITGGQDLNNPLLTAFFLVLMTKTSGIRPQEYDSSPLLSPNKGMLPGYFIGQEGLNCRFDGNDISHHPAAFTSKHSKGVGAPSASPQQQDGMVHACIKCKSFSSQCPPAWQQDPIPSSDTLPLPSVSQGSHIISDECK